MEVHKVFEDSLRVDIFRATRPLLTVDDLIAFVDQGLSHSKKPIARQVFLSIKYWVRLVRKTSKLEHLHCMSCDTITGKTVLVYLG